MWWEILEIEYTVDIDTIKKAYSEKIKLFNVEENPEMFMKIKDAYKAAMNHARFMNKKSLESKQNIESPFVDFTLIEPKIEIASNKFSKEEIAPEETIIDFELLLNRKRNTIHSNRKLNKSVSESEADENTIVKEMTNRLRNGSLNNEADWIVLLHSNRFFDYFDNDGITELILFLEDIYLENINYKLRVEIIIPALKVIAYEKYTTRANMIKLEEIIKKASVARQSYYAKNGMFDTVFRYRLRQKHHKKNTNIIFKVIRILYSVLRFVVNFLGIILFLTLLFSQ